MTWSKSWPEGTKPLRDGDDKIRLNMDHLQDSLSREHTFPGTYGGDSGRHTFHVGTPATVAGIGSPVNGMIVGRSDLPIIGQRQAGSFVYLTGYKFDTAANRAAFATADLPTGFMWLESDTGFAYVWNGSIWVKWIWPSSTPLHSRDVSTLEQQVAAAGSWYQVDKAGPTLMKATITIPATGDWWIYPTARIAMSRTGSVAGMAARLRQDYDAGSAVTTLDQITPSKSQDFVDNVSLAGEPTDATGENGKVYFYYLEYSCRTTTNVYVNRPEAAAGHGPAGAIPPQSWVMARAERVG